MDGAKKRGSYIKGESSDWIVKEVLARKEHLLFFNPRGKGGGAALRTAAAEEITASFNEKFPECGEKKWSQIKDHFDCRRDQLKKALSMANLYVGGTGGGREKDKESLVSKLENPSEADALIISFLKKQDGLLGVGDRYLETGHDMGEIIQGYGLGRGEEMEEEGEEEPSSSHGPPQMKRAQKGALTKAGLEKARALSNQEWLEAASPLMAARAATLGYRKAGTKRVNLEGDTEGKVEVKKVKKEEHSADQMNGVVSSLAVLQHKGIAAIEGMESLRAAVRFGGDRLTKQDLEAIIADYDRKIGHGRRQSMEEDEDIIQLG